MRDLVNTASYVSSDTAAPFPELVFCPKKPLRKGANLTMSAADYIGNTYSFDDIFSNISGGDIVVRTLHTKLSGRCYVLATNASEEVISIRVKRKVQMFMVDNGQGR